MHEKNFIPLSFIQRRVNNGASTKFWHDTWIGTSPLRFQFPRLFRLSTRRDCLIRDCWDNGWHLDWIRNVSRGTNANQLATLQNILSEVSLNDTEDVWVWSIDTPFFTVKSARQQLDTSFLPGDGIATRWNRLLPKKINIFIWRSLRDRLPSRWNLSRKGIDVLSITCPNCDHGIDFAFHTLWVCPLAAAVWTRTFNWLDLSPTVISNLLGLYSWIDGLHMSSSRKDILEVVCGVTLWSLWSFRNEVIFGSVQPIRSMLFDKIVDFSFRWFSFRSKSSTISWNNWIQNPLVVYFL
ncbi:RNA-directed DNA polymerase, eukaryota [Tanacetum coccineum]